MTNVKDFERVAAARGILPEGIIWRSTGEQLSWVDIELGLLHVAAVDGGSVRMKSIFDLGDQLGCALPSAAGGWICGLGRSLATVSELGIVSATPPLLGDSERFNDGHIDPQGRLVIGTLNTSGPDGHQLLLRLENDARVTIIDDTLGISNGIAWSPDGLTMFHADTAARTITRRDYGDIIGPPEVFAVIGGMPDGIAVDADGRVWVTVFDQGRVDVYSATGELLPEQSIVLPNAHIASVGFAGPSLDVLVLATGMPVMPQWLRRRRGDDGYLFVGHSVTTGQAATEWIPTELPHRIER